MTSALITIDFDSKKDLWYGILKKHGVETEDFFEAFERRISLKHIPSIGDFLTVFVDISHCLDDYRDLRTVYKKNVIEIVVRVDGIYWMFDENDQFKSLEITGEFEG